MKKIIAIMLLLCLVVSMAAGCGSSLKEPVSFYYLRDPDFIVYGAYDGLIAPEEREAAGHVEDLQYLLTLYLGGPLDEELVSPFPEGVRLRALAWENDSLVIELSENFSQLSGVELSSACACISATCFSLSDAAEVTIISPGSDRQDGIHITVNRQSFALIDEILPAPSTGSDEK